MTLRVMDVMTRGAQAMAPADSLRRSAQAMDDLNVGALPVCRRSRVVGIVTDRDIVVRAVAQARPADVTTVQDVMTTDVRCCYEDQSLDDAIEAMRRHQVRRLPVLDRQHLLVGIVSLGDIATKGGHAAAAVLLADVSQPCEPDLDHAAVRPAHAPRPPGDPLATPTRR
jgi:CBS domain-containing protein